MKGMIKKIPTDVMIKNIPSFGGDMPEILVVPGKILTGKDLVQKKAELSLRVHAINKNGYPVSIGLSEEFKERVLSGEKVTDVKPSDLVAETRLDRWLDSL